MPTANAGETVVIPLAIGGEYTAGDPSTQPDGTTRLLQNYAIRPNRYDGRSPWVDDTTGGTTDMVRYFRWEDLGSKVTRTIGHAHSGLIYQKASAGGVVGAGWSGGTSVSGTNNYLSMGDYANLLGKVYVMLCNDTGAVPTTQLAFSWDGASVSVAPFDAAITSRTITSFIDRYFLGYPVETITPQTQSSFVNSVYDLTSALWVKTNVAAYTNTYGSKVYSTLLPTSTTASSITPYTAGTPNVGLASFAPSATVRSATWRSDLHCWHPSYSMPITMEIILVTNWKAATAYVVGDLITDGAGHMQRVTTAGTSGGAAPGWNATVNGTTADGAGALVWTNIGSDILASLEDYIPSGTRQPDFTTFYLGATIPPATNTITVSPRLKFFNSLTPTITLAGVDVSLRDGVADGGATKANRGQQVTFSEYNYDFVNTETATFRTADIEDIVWSEINQPNRVLAKNSFSLPEVAGYVTAAAVAGGRYFVFKRRGLWQFARTSDPNIPIIPEKPANTDIGCVGPRAIDSYMDELFWIDEHDIYRMRVGEDPRAICGPGMREEILSKVYDATAVTGWVENLGTVHTPYLVVDKTNHDVYVLTQNKKLYVYNIDTDQWAVMQFYDGTGIDGTIAAIFYDTLGQRMLMSVYQSNTTRLNELATTKDVPTAINSITNTITFKPIEGFAPRPELQIDGLSVFHNATASQTGETLSVQYSLDRGSTWTTPTGYPLQVDTSDALIPMPFTASGHSIMVRLVRVGSGGAAKWSLSKVSAQIKVLSGEFNYTVGTSV